MYLKELGLTDASTTDQYGKLVYASLNDLEKMYRGRYKDLADYTSCFYIGYTNMIEKIFEEMKDNLIECIYGVPTIKDLFPEFFIAKNKDFFVISDFYISNNDNHCLLFFNDATKAIELLTDKETRCKPGIYYLNTSGSGYKLARTELTEETDPLLNDHMMDVIKKEVTNFFGNKKFFKDNKFQHKRGILFYGPPGSGKSSTARSILRENQDKYCIIIDCTKEFGNDITSFLRGTTSKSPKIIIFEDIQSINEYNRSAFLNFLDGIDSLENMFVIATTNDVSMLDKALVNRPSRFDKLFYFGNPDDDVRKALLMKFFPETSEEDIEDAVRKTKDFSGAYIKELYTFKTINGYTLIESINELKKQIELFSTTKNTEYMG